MVVAEWVWGKGYFFFFGYGPRQDRHHRHLDYAVDLVTIVHFLHIDQIGSLIKWHTHIKTATTQTGTRVARKGKGRREKGGGEKKKPAQGLSLSVDFSRTRAHPQPIAASTLHCSI